MPEEINFKKREGSISMRETLVWDQLAALLLGRWKVTRYGRSTQRKLLLTVKEIPPKGMPQCPSRPHCIWVFTVFL